MVRMFTTDFGLDLKSKSTTTFTHKKSKRAHNIQNIIIQLTNPLQAQYNIHQQNAASSSTQKTQDYYGLCNTISSSSDCFGE